MAEPSGPPPHLHLPHPHGWTLYQVRALLPAHSAQHPQHILDSPIPLIAAAYLADQLPLLVHADVETCGCPLDAHAAPEGVRLHDELGWGKQREEREGGQRGSGMEQA